MCYDNWLISERYLISDRSFSSLTTLRFWLFAFSLYSDDNLCHYILPTNQLRVGWNVIWVFPALTSITLMENNCSFDIVVVHQVCNPVSAGRTKRFSDGLKCSDSYFSSTRQFYLYNFSVMKQRKRTLGRLCRWSTFNFLWLKTWHYCKKYHFW